MYDNIHFLHFAGPWLTWPFMVEWVNVKKQRIVLVIIKVIFFTLQVPYSAPVIPR